MSLILTCVSGTPTTTFQFTQNRRSFNNGFISLVGYFTASGDARAAIDQNNKPSFLVYKVNPDSSSALSPTIEAIQPSMFQKIISSTNSMNGGVVWLGEHHNSAKDHILQTEFIRSIYNEHNKGDGTDTRPVSIGLEQIQVQYQSVLDDFVSGKISEKKMLEEVQWEKRWSWPYENYKPIFSLAKELNIPLIALNVNSEDLAAVEIGGITGLSREQIKKYIKDPKGFGDFAKLKSYETYVNYVIEPSYDLHKSIGLLKTTMSGAPLEKEMSFQNFFCGRILWDEGMAGNAFEWTKKNPGGLLVGLVGADHVKFNMGVRGRYDALCKGQFCSTSVLLNPTLIDTRPSGSVWNYENSDSSRFPEMLTLQLRYLKDGVSPTSEDSRSYASTGGVLPLCDYFVISNDSSSA